MKGILTAVLLLIFGFSGANAQEYRKISKTELQEILKNPSDKLHVVNFWATWCGPCVAELPAFQEVVNALDKTKVDFLFVSLDFPSNADKKLGPFLKKNKYTFNTVLMTETDYNSWIDLVHPDWGGSIPATLFFNHARKIREFIPEAIENEKLNHTIETLLKI